MAFVYFLNKQQYIIIDGTWFTQFYLPPTRLSTNERIDVDFEMCAVCVCRLCSQTCVPGWRWDDVTRSKQQQLQQQQHWTLVDANTDAQRLLRQRLSYAELQLSFAPASRRLYPERRQSRTSLVVFACRWIRWRHTAGDEAGFWTHVRNLTAFTCIFGIRHPVVSAKGSLLARLHI